MPISSLYEEARISELQILTTVPGQEQFNFVLYNLPYHVLLDTNPSVLGELLRAKPGSNLEKVAQWKRVSPYSNERKISSM
jgi:hypothetical protein